MSKLAYLDCPTGISGDMCLGAVVAAGVPLEYLTEKLKGLGIESEYRLRAERVHRNGQLATKVHVDLLTSVDNHHDPDQEHQHPHEHEHGHNHGSSCTSGLEPHLPHLHYPPQYAPTRHLPEIEQLILAAQLPPRVSEWSLAVFRNLAEAEGAVHGIAPDQIHFHEVGATDAIVDIVGSCLGLDWLGIDQLYCSALPTGGGTVQAAHGRLPVPVPAVLKLWESGQVPVYSNGINRELVTPTGAALTVTLATGFGSVPAMTIQKVGLGAGSIQLPIPNILRLWIGESSQALTVGTLKAESQNHQISTPQNQQLSIPKNIQASNLETISVLETQIDDLSPQAIGYVFETLFKAGAVDVFTQAIGMKKSRPGILLTVICHPQDIEACEAVLFHETTTLGIRRLTQQRTILSREIQQVQTKYGEIRVKVAWSNSSPEKRITNVQPEYEDCARVARFNHCSWREIHQLALQAWYRQYGEPFQSPELCH
ncbi:nickel pincer cofactor biosynthesis protein LarC [Allocoleopsis franciscana]|uniref:Putative nickel insertion protein n=1 Tax=Allocoleopsis franciscana PCC 7113 TaxID=1173027 RepID=K9WK32_9CYAN|nr:nickel pincer cofactor biosynthesis protein LarC [Allocoleopsis franciscana]AFZ20114.1 TIGR00299 family protein [Allocoleopsis franciscana PCC 7113]